MPLDRIAVISHLSANFEVKKITVINTNIGANWLMKPGRKFKKYLNTVSFNGARSMASSFSLMSNITITNKSIRMIKKNVPMNFLIIYRSNFLTNGFFASFFFSVVDDSADSAELSMSDNCFCSSSSLVSTLVVGDVASPFNSSGCMFSMLSCMMLTIIGGV